MCTIYKNTNPFTSCRYKILFLGMDRTTVIYGSFQSRGPSTIYDICQLLYCIVQIYFHKNSQSNFYSQTYIDRLKHFTNCKYGIFMIIFSLRKLFCEIHKNLSHENFGLHLYNFKVLSKICCITLQKLLRLSHQEFTTDYIMVKNANVFYLVNVSHKFVCGRNSVY